jgi:hypothetical protein
MRMHDVFRTGETSHVQLYLQANYRGRARARHLETIQRLPSAGHVYSSFIITAEAGLTRYLFGPPYICPVFENNVLIFDKISKHEIPACHELYQRRFPG